MRSEEPTIGADSVLGAAMAAAPGSAGEIQFRDIVHQQQIGPRERRRPLLGGCQFKARAEAVIDAAFSGRSNLGCVKIGADVHHARSGRLPCGFWTLRFRAPQYSGGSSQLGVGEKSGLPIANREGQAVACVALVLEEENAGVALTRMSRDFDFVTQCFAAARQPVVKAYIAAAHAIYALAAHVKVDAEP